MQKNSSAIGLFGDYQDAALAVKALQTSGYDMKKLSVIRKDSQDEAIPLVSFSPFGGVPACIGLPPESISRYELALKARKFIFIVHGTVLQVTRAKDIFLRNSAEEARVTKPAGERVKAADQRLAGEFSSG